MYFIVMKVLSLLTSEKVFAPRLEEAHGNEELRQYQGTSFWN